MGLAIGTTKLSESLLHKPGRRHAFWAGVALLAVVALVAVATHLRGAGRVAGLIRDAAWLLPLLVLWHLGQLFVAGIAWRALLAAPPAGTGAFWRLRIIREGIDSLLPVAQVGGELEGSRLLARRGTTLGRAGASVIVDLSLEILSQFAFLLSGLACLALRDRISGDQTWIRLALGAAAAGAGILLVQAGGGLRWLEALSAKIAQRWPKLGGLSLDGLQGAAAATYRRRRAVGVGFALHVLAWGLGTCETWAVLHAMGFAVSPEAAWIVESLGMAARSAGFAIPAALGAQEGGFILAAAAVGVGAPAALALSLIKRARELAGGTIGLTLWRLESARAAARAGKAELGQA